MACRRTCSIAAAALLGLVAMPAVAQPPPAAPRLVATLRAQSSAASPCRVSLVGSLELDLPPGWSGPVPRLSYQFADNLGRRSPVRTRQPYAAKSYFVVAQTWPPVRPARVGWTQLQVSWGGLTASSDKALYRPDRCGG